MSERIERLAQKPSTDIVERLVPLIKSVSEGVEEGRDCGAEIAEINALSGRNIYGPQHFFELDSHTSAEHFAELAAMGKPPLVPDLSRDELVEVLEIIMGESGDADPIRCEYFIDFLDRNLPRVWSSDLVFWPTVERTPAELADYLIAEAARTD